MNPTITIPREHEAVNVHAGATPTSTRGSDTIKLPQFFKRLFKFPQMDFEMAVWEMTTLLFAPKKVFRSIYYHPETCDTHPRYRSSMSDYCAIETKNTWHRPDPSFTYLLSFFMLLTGLAWGIATTFHAWAIIRLTFLYVFVHLLAMSLLVAAASYFLIGKLLGPGVAGLPGRRRQQGLFGREGGTEELEFGYCFDVAIRAFFPVWVLLYVVQFVLWPLIAQKYWLSLFFGNTLYLAAAGYYFIITFLGYNTLPFLSHTQFILAPLVLMGILWFISLLGFNIPRHFAPILALGAWGPSKVQA
ncbi:hypothetical protein MMC25_005115 [Agyrium rufum]|nr:hypothetical protein [Agyrium rufum]